MPAVREHRRLDWLLGIAIGVVLGLGVLTAFVFFGSEDTVDAPRISGAESGQPVVPDAQADPGQAQTERLSGQ